MDNRFDCNADCNGALEVDCNADCNETGATQAMSEKMVHYVAGPKDGETMLLLEGQHPFAAALSTDTDGFYV